MLVQPTLNLQFARARFQDPRINFSRPGTQGAYTRNALGQLELVPPNQMRFDYDPVTGQSLGALIEESRTNLLLWSQDFSNSVWAKNRASVVAGFASPAGDLTAYKLVESTDSGNHQLAQTVPTAEGAEVWLSVFLRAGGRRYARVQSLLFANQDTRTMLDVDLLTGEIVNLTGAGAFAGRVTPSVGGWWKIEVRSIRNSTGSDSRIGVDTLDENRNVDYAGDGSSGIYVWQADVQTGKNAGTPIFTTDAPATRAADRQYISDISGILRPANFTITSDAFVEQRPTNYGVLFRVGDSDANRVEVRRTPTSLLVMSRGGGTDNPIVSLADPWAGRKNARIAVSCSATTIDVAVNGALVATQAYTPMTAATRIDLGSDHNGAAFSQMTGHIASLQVFPAALNAELIGGAA